MCKHALHLSKGQRYTMQAHDDDVIRLPLGVWHASLSEAKLGAHHWETDSLLPFANTSMTASCLSG